MPQGNSKALQVIEEVRSTVIGKDMCIIKVMAAIIAGGHILIEDIPGVGKTTMAMAFSKAMDMEEKRVQFTPDVMPADLTGFSVYQSGSSVPQYQPGAVMCNLLLADEINRSSPKTQSALLEVMEEGYVTVDGTRIRLPEPFVVIATQNPFGSAGTQPLPPSQLDRFLIRLSMGYPSVEQEVAITKGSTETTREINKVMSTAQLLAMREECRGIFVHDEIYAYMARLAKLSREDGFVELGLSPRGTIALAKMSKAMAFLSGRSYVTPEDLMEIFPEVCSHRIFLKPKAKAMGSTVEAVLSTVLSKAEKPSVRRTRAQNP